MTESREAQVKTGGLCGVNASVAAAPRHSADLLTEGEPTCPDCRVAVPQPQNLSLSPCTIWGSWWRRVRERSAVPGGVVTFLCGCAIVEYPVCLFKAGT